jgi:hypothetical protein
MNHTAYRWLAWLGLWLLIAANARATEVSQLPVASGVREIPAPLWGAVAMALVIGVWIVIAHSIAKSRAQRRVSMSLARVWVPRVERKRPPHP